MRRVDKVADKVEERVNKEGPKWMDKVLFDFNFAINTHRFNKTKLI